MKVLHLCTHQNGGAGIACLRLHNALRASGTESKLLSVCGLEDHEKGIFSLECGNKADFKKINWKTRWIRYLQSWRVRLAGKPKELFSFPDSIWKIEEHPLIAEADIIHLHWVAGMIDVKRFFGKIIKPVVWTLHDAWPFTGGFHYEAYFNIKPFASISKPLLERKSAAYEQKNIAVVSPSNYLLNLCLKSKVFRSKPHIRIPNGLDDSIYYYRSNRDELRHCFGINKNEHVLLFASAELDYYRKGFDILINAFITSKNKHLRLFVVGEKRSLNPPLDERITYFGPITDENYFAELLSACDSLVHTSREDNFPNVIIEALSCGTPVLALDNGGVSEMLTHQVNGILISNDKIHEGFDQVLSLKPDRMHIAASAKFTFSSALQSRRFEDLYLSLLNF